MGRLNSMEGWRSGLTRPVYNRVSATAVALRGFESHPLLTLPEPMAIGAAISPLNQPSGNEPPSDDLAVNI